MTAPDAAAPHIHLPDGSCCKPKRFAHLHQHTQYSLLDGAAKLKDLLKWAKEVTPEGCTPALAMTDHGNMHGAVHFYNYATGMGVKPIIGYEAYVVPGQGTRRDRTRGQDGEKGIFHLTLLARDFEGYQNLCRLSSRGYTEGYYYKPRIDHELLQEHHKGVIAFSGCLGSEVQQLLLQGREDDAKKRLLWYRELFGENYFIEIQDHGLPEQKKNNPILKAWAQELGIGLVATNDGHYVKKSDATAHETLLAIQTKATLADENRFKFPCDEFYVKDLEEMQRALPVADWGEEPFDNTAMIAELCNVDLPVGKKRVYQMPALPIPEGRTMAEELRVQTYRGTVKRYPGHATENLLRDYAQRSLAALGEDAPAVLQRVDGCDARTCDLETLLTLLAFMGSVWEARGKAAGEKYTKYPALELMEAEAEAGGLPAYAHEDCRKASQKDSDTRIELDPAAPDEETTRAHHKHALVILRRAEYELSVINNMGFPDYFLIVADYINWAKDQDISVGPGRGSGAGSLVAYAMRITNLDPLEFELLFERFLNPDRISMPDFDIDFNDARRGEVIAYVQDKYGEDKVAQIATFGTMASKACLKDVARVMGLEYAKVDKVSKLIPIKFGKSYSLEQAREAVPDIQQLLAEDAQLLEAYEFAQKLEGLTRHASVHAAGVVIGKTQLTDLVPVMRDTSGEGMVCQYDMKAVEDIGLIKMDFLGLRTLSFLDEAKRILKESGTDFEDTYGTFDNIPFDDEKTYALMSRGDTKGVFQLEGAGIADASRRLKPRRLADIIALSALYRPGPMENIPTYVRRHHGLEEVNYERDGFPASAQHLEKILAETYGIPVYQEQIMQIASEVAGFSLGGADLLRRAMGKKDAEEMKRQRQIFVDGAEKNGVPKEEGNKLFDLLDAFANYGFNKCLTGDTRVPVAGGELRRMEDLYREGRQVELPSVNAAYRLELRPTGQFFDNGVKPVFKVKTALGRELTATGNHPLLTLDGWRNVDDLTAGDRIAAPARLPELGTDHWPEHEAGLLGWVLAEGNTCHPCGAYLYSQSEAQVADMVALAGQFPNTRPSVKARPDRHNVHDVYLGTGLRGSAAGKSGVRLWLEGLGLVGVKATEKALPTAAFRLNNASLAVLVGRYWSGDGFLSGPGNTTPYAATASRQLADDLAHVLLRLGMVAKVSEKHFAYARGEDTAGRTGYTVHLVGRRSIDQFLTVVAPHLVGREAQLAALRAYYAGTPQGRETVDTVPASIKARVQTAKQASGLGWREIEAQTGVCTKEFYGAPKAHKKGFRRATIQTLGEFFEDAALLDACSEELYWDTIVSIEPAGEAQTYDLEVPGTHNFVANDLVVHNSHSAAYGVITYQTAWLKANYPVQFMAALLTVERKDSDKVAEYVSDARKMDVRVLPPDINRSAADFAVQGEEILFGLYAIKGLGEAAVQKILEERERAGRFKSLADFCSRLGNKVCNRKAMESLIKSGAFDQFGERNQLMHSLEDALEDAAGAADINAKAQSGMAMMFGMDEVKQERPLRAGIAPFTDLERLSIEKEALGLYISGHPLEQHEGLREAASCRISDLDTWFQTQNVAPGKRIKAVLAGMIESVVKKPTKSGGMMARFILADESGQTELVAFSRAYERIQDKLVNDTPALVIVELESEDGGLRAIAEEVVSVEQLADVPKVMYVTIDLENATPDAVGEFQSVLDEHAGSMPTYLRLETPEQFVLYQLDHGMGSPEAIRVLNQTFPWAEAYLAYDQQTILGRFAPKPPAWMNRQNGGGMRA
ncbi:DNA polymerase III subunit alpha [Deinococcus multiflagellatus]|uniref:DNA polymerase III subunit alpha n=1 Tax=Deinococcus multiflagellatus TaxID=1656887 RepID=A0ABW1ZM86_9DEIO|nr:DNA polymerase III subunit alpha [Deinococcus multiflagellatus]MBZ9713888.1 DNA polymerase III subunit alpha [Deinococcus multiflagellatus]